MTRIFSNRKTPGLNRHYYDYDSLLRNNNEQQQKRCRLYLRAMYDATAQEGNRRLFLGIGCLAGQIRKHNSRKSTIIAPLLFVPVSLEYESAGVDYEILWEDIQLNYDGLATLLQLATVDDSESDNPHHLAPEMLIALSAIEQSLSTIHHQQEFLEETFVGNIWRTLQQAIRQLYGIATSQQEFAIDNLRSYLDNEAVFFNTRFFFQADTPSDISIAHGIRNITSQIEQEGDCDNNLLKKLLEGVLEDRSIEIQRNLMPDDEVERAILQLPISLSEPQKQGIRNAWTSEVSYIQGPPGTGKSHTITAILLSAILLGKKVLLVSQKKAAIDIIREKLNRTTRTSTYISDNTILFAGSLPEDRRALKSYIQSYIQSAKNSSVASTSSPALHYSHLINALTDRVYELTNDLHMEVELHHEFYKSTFRFSALHSYFRSTYPDSLITCLAERPGDLSSLVDYLFEIDKRYRNDGALLKKEVLSLKISLRRLLHVLGADADEAKIYQWLALRQFSNIAQYFSRLHEVTLLRSRILARQRSLRPPDELRSEIEQQQTRLKSTTLEYLRTSYEEHLRSSATTSRNNADLFARMLHFRKPNRITRLMQSIDYKNFTDTFRLWTGEIRDIGDYIAFTPELFDLVIVDEASQVNIAEFLPVFYRGRRICIVGDEHQLGLQASGMFTLNRNFERMIWNQQFPALPYEAAKTKNILVSESSILDFIISDNTFAVPKVMLNEHFRSMPQLSHFTSKQFYNGELRIMTEVGNNPLRSCFQMIQVAGQRKDGEKMIPAEVEAAIDIIRGIIRNSLHRTDPQLSSHTFPDDLPTLGIVAFTSDQVQELRERLRDELDTNELARHHVLVGTPEEFQGNERNIIIITPAVDKLHSGAAFYGNVRRFNVATSRATHFTYFIYTALSSQLMHSYRDYIESMQPASGHRRSAFYNEWKFSTDFLTTEFDHNMSECLHRFVEQHSTGNLHLYNAVESCGHHLDFAILNTTTGTCVAIGTEGKTYTNDTGKPYATRHYEQTQVLHRAGWRIVHLPYFRWYNDGRAQHANDPLMAGEVESLYQHLAALLDIEHL